jgi:hypothetical protein
VPAADYSGDVVVVGEFQQQGGGEAFAGFLGRLEVGQVSGDALFQ